MRILSLIAIILVAGVQTASADSAPDATWLRQVCREGAPQPSDDPQAIGRKLANDPICFGYLRGLMEAHVATTAILGQPALFCVPNGVTSEHVRLTVAKYVDQYPENLHHPSSHVALTALAAGYPCR